VLIFTKEELHEEDEFHRSARGDHHSLEERETIIITFITIKNEYYGRT